jgi:hypothetical protein
MELNLEINAYEAKYRPILILCHYNKEENHTSRKYLKIT